MCFARELQKKFTSIKPLRTNIPPDEAIRASFTNYIKSALQWSAEYKAIKLNSSPQVLDFTSVLGEDICEKRPALMSLVSTLETGMSDGLFAPCNTQITAQALWSAMFGLLMRLIIEQDVSSEQKSRLIDRQIDILLKGLRP